MFKFVKDVNNRNIRKADTTKLYLPGGRNLTLQVENNLNEPTTLYS